MKADLRELAKQYYVYHQLGINKILLLLNDPRDPDNETGDDEPSQSVCRKTLYNWKKEDKWDELREEHLKNNKTDRELLRAYFHAAVGAATDDPEDPMKGFNVAKQVAAMGLFKEAKLDDFTKPLELDEEKVKDSKFISSKTIQEVKKVLGMA